MAANLSGVLRSSVLFSVHAHASKNFEPGQSIIFVFEPLHIVFKIFVARQTAWDCRPISLLNPQLHRWNTSAVICLDISVELNRDKTVYIGLSRAQQVIVKRDL